MEQNMINLINYLGIFFWVFGTAGVSGCTVCQEQGDCKLLSGLFMKGSLNPGYNDITQIPEGACAINITIIRPSSNRLALGLEGSTEGLFINPVENASTPTGFYHSGGISFYYYRGDALSREQIIAEGPLPKPLNLQLYVSEVNKGVEYRYMYPVTNSDTNIIESSYKQDSKDVYNSLHSERDVNSSPYGEREAYSPYADKDTYRQYAEKEAYSPYAERDVYSQYPSATKPSKSRHNSFTDIQENRFSWTLKMLTTCSRSCGGGFQSTVAVCIKTRQNKVVSDSKCRRRDKPSAQVVPCNRTPCPPVWSPGPWAPCTRTCGEGVQVRQVRCEQELSPNLRITAPEAVCSQRSSRSHIVTSRKCDLGPCSAQELVGIQGVEKELSRSSKLKNSTLDRRSAASTPTGESTSGWGVTSGRSWTNSPADAWTRTPSSSSHQVDPRSSYPNQWTAEPMRSNGPTQRTQGWTSSPQEWKHKESLTEWVAQPWGLCSVTCGQGVKERRVHCMDKRGGLLPDSRCENLGRPESESFCNMGACPINQWLVGSWDVCTAQCGEGKEYRDVYCSGACSQTDRPQASRPCNATKPCSGHWVTGRWSICSRSCGPGYQKRDVLCVHADNTIDSGGNEMRQLCNMKTKPRERRQCNIQSCKPSWVTSQWSKCSASCGVGVETRHVVCLDGGERSSLCQNKEKPANSRECQANCTAPLLEIDQEQAEDIYNEDSDATNDDDNQEYNYDEYEEILDEPEQRDVGDNNEDSKDITDIISNKLDSLITSTRLMTNEVLHTADSLIPGNSLLEEDQDPAADGSKIQASPQVCLDNFKNCAIVVESELCKYNFYQINCCQSCTLNLK